MTRNLNKELKKYYRDIGKALSDSKENKTIITSIKSAVKCYIYDHPDSTYDDIIRQFGSPEQVIEHYYSSEKAKEFAHRLNRNKKIAIIVGIIALIVFLFLILLFISQIDAENGYIKYIYSDVSNSDQIIY